ncbi:hypothetical protein Pla163_17650 [Planctomycetes bacterium Pla163]|uniref:Uncharacterized protein n=1 Tax=Rohdeia mirabilis TaxID=2528008 RepID=A0A518CZL5_9BACT|nr:hypothetical protein Pla163_17650 [Planctomycetes bacterium Pla163]
MEDTVRTSSNRWRGWSQKHSPARVPSPRNEKKRRGPLGLHRFFEW